jgi:hypothetical protein
MFIPQKVTGKGRESMIDDPKMSSKQCGAMLKLQVHNQKFRSQSGNDSEQNLITLCSECHASIHRKRWSA